MQQTFNQTFLIFENAFWLAFLLKIRTLHFITANANKTLIHTLNPPIQYFTKNTIFLSAIKVHRRFFE